MSGVKNFVLALSAWVPPLFYPHMVENMGKMAGDSGGDVTRPEGDGVCSSVILPNAVAAVDSLCVATAIAARTELMVWYMKVDWHHECPDEPVTLYSEIGDDGYESRKVNIFPDGHLEWADAEHESAHTGLGEVPVPGTEEIDEQGEFSAEEISRDVFEAVWAQATTRLTDCC